MKIIKMLFICAILVGILFVGGCIKTCPTDECTANIDCSANKLCCGSYVPNTIKGANCYQKQCTEKSDLTGYCPIT